MAIKRNQGGENLYHQKATQRGVGVPPKGNTKGREYDTRGNMEQRGCDMKRQHGGENGVHQEEKWKGETYAIRKQKGKRRLYH